MLSQRQPAVSRRSIKTFQPCFRYLGGCGYDPACTDQPAGKRDQVHASCRQSRDRSGEDNGWVKVWVKDNGPGISAADRERIFEKFTRLRGNNSPSGLGVGLAFCRLAVQGHGGQIWVESELGKGTTFWLTLPVVKNEQAGTLKSASLECRSYASC